MTATSALGESAYLAALAGLDHMTTKRFQLLLARRTPAEAFDVASGAAPATGLIIEVFRKYPDLRARWLASSRQRTPERCWQECVDSDITVVAATAPDFPSQLIDDPTCPPVLFVRGDLSVLDARRIGIVGTRNATQLGRQTAARFGHELASAGVVVVSGLALGIDGAAHRGCLAANAAPPVAIVGNGLDCPYPRRHRALWESVADRGAILSEWPPGTVPDAFRFPLRNRLIAALSEVLLVVESRERGGSLSTAREAAERGVDVFAVPGSLDSRASIGTNQLLRDGAAPATDPEDLLMVLGIDRRREGRRRYDARRRPDQVGTLIMSVAAATPCTLETLSAATGLSLVEAALGLAHLERDGWLVETGGWFEPVDEWAGMA